MVFLHIRFFQPVYGPVQLLLFIQGGQSQRLEEVVHVVLDAASVLHGIHGLQSGRLQLCDCSVLISGHIHRSHPDLVSILGERDDSVLSGLALRFGVAGSVELKVLLIQLQPRVPLGTSCRRVPRSSGLGSRDLRISLVWQDIVEDRVHLHAGRGIAGRKCLAVSHIQPVPVIFSLQHGNGFAVGSRNLARLQHRRYRLELREGHYGVK